MTRLRFSAFLGMSVLFLLSLVMVACGADTVSPVPSTPNSPAATLVNTPTSAPATMPTITFTAISTKTSIPTIATTNPVEFIRKFDTPELKGPMGIAVDRQGNLYVADDKSDQVLKYDAAGNFVTRWGSSGAEDGQFQFLDPKTRGDGGFLAVDGQGNVYVSDSYNTRIQKFDGNGKFILKWDVNPGSLDASASIGPIAVDSQGNVYTGGFGLIQKFDNSGKLLAKWTNDGTPGDQFGVIAVNAIDSQGNIFISEVDNAHVRKLDQNGKLVAKWGGKGQGDGQFTLPLTLVLDSHGNIYVGDVLAGRIQIFNAGGKFISQWNYAGNNEIKGATGMAIDAQGNIYIGDLGQVSIYKFKPKV